MSPRPIVAEGGMWLTSSPHQAGNRQERSALDAARLARAPIYVRTIKLADLIDNGSLIAEHDPEFAKVWLAEMRLLMLVLLGGDRRLWMRAEEWLDQQQMSAVTPSGFGGPVSCCD